MVVSGIEGAGLIVVEQTEKRTRTIRLVCRDLTHLMRIPHPVASSLAPSWLIKIRTFCLTESTLTPYVRQ